MTPLSVACHLGRMSRFKVVPFVPEYVPPPVVIAPALPPPVFTFVSRDVPPLRKFAINKAGEVRPTVGLVLHHVAQAYGVTHALIKSDIRTAGPVLVRQVYFYLGKKMTFGSLPEIARRAGDRDHTTALHGCRRIEAKMADDLFFAAEVAQIETNIIAEMEAALSRGNEC